MKKILFIIVLFLGFTGYSQSQASPEVTLFGQCMIEVNDAQTMKNLEQEMRSNPYVKVVRLDYLTQRAFILTKGIDQLTEEQFVSWFNGFSGTVRCVQIGRHGVDVIKPYPFEGCEKN